MHGTKKIHSDNMIFLMVAVLSAYNIDNKIALAQVSIETHGSIIVGQSIVLECKVTSFGGGGATWSQDNGINILTQCNTGGLCTDSGTGNYRYTSDSNGINVTISLTSSELGKTWTCTHATFRTSKTVYNRTLTISYSGSNKLKSTTYTLQCKIPGFNDQASWSKEGVAMAICFNSGCQNLSQNYRFSQDNSAIYVSFITLTEDEHDKQWKCEHVSNTAVYFTVEVDSSEIVIIKSSAMSCAVGLLIGIVNGLIVTLVHIVLISSVVAKKYCFPNMYVCRGTVIYGLHIAIVGAVCQIASLSITMGVVIHYYGQQYSKLAKLLIAFMTHITPCLGVLGFLCIVAAFGKKELIHKIFDNIYERLSLTKSFGVKFTTHNSSLISFKIKTKKNANIGVIGANHGAPLITVILGYREKNRSVVMEPNQLQPKDEKRGEVISSTEFKTVHLKCEQNHLTLLNGNEETILTWKSDKNTSLEIKDIAISNSFQGTDYEEFESAESGEWIILVRQGDCLDERDDDARCFKNVLLVIVVVVPIAWLVLPIIGLWRWCKKDDSTSNRENGLNVSKKKSKKSQSFKIEGGDIEIRGIIENSRTRNDHDRILDKNMSNRGNEKQVLTPIPAVYTHIAGESKLNQKQFGTAVPLPPIDSPKDVNP